MFTLRRDIVVYNLPSFPIPPKSSPLPSYNLPSFRIPLKSSPLPRRLRSDSKHACETVTEKNDDADINNDEDAPGGLSTPIGHAQAAKIDYGQTTMFSLYALIVGFMMMRLKETVLRRPG